MKIEVIAIGNEILSGNTVNTNAAFISNELLKAGLSVYRHTVLSDEESQLREGLTEGLKRSDVVLTTGGLGPTYDDTTRKVVARLFGTGFTFHPEIAADLKERYGDHRLIRLEDQSTLPSLAKPIRNRVGTAPGLLFEANDALLIMMPGVPPEMKVMMMEQVIPYLQKTLQPKMKKYYRNIHLFNLPESAVDTTLRDISSGYPEIEVGIYPNLGLLSVGISTVSENEPMASALLEKAKNILVGKFTEHIFESENGRIEQAVHDLFIAKGLTLSTAESCTGGSVAARLTRIPGASKYFMGSLVTYSNQLKMSLLDVSEKTLKDKGAVSEEVVKEMAKGLLAKTGTDYGLAVTGIAGPEGGTAEKPVGTVWGALIRKGNEPYAWKFRGYGGRDMIIERSVNALLAEAYMSLKAD